MNTPKFLGCRPASVDQKEAQHLLGFCRPEVAFILGDRWEAPLHEQGLRPKDEGSSGVALLRPL